MFKLILTGNVGKSPEPRATQSGDVFVTFSVGVSVGTKQNPKTQWVEVSCNGKLADVAGAHITVGQKIMVEGYPSVNAYINKNNEAIGTMRVNAHNIEFLSSKQSEHVGNSEQLKPNDPPF
jgi:single-strand DNA-binding protein